MKTQGCIATISSGDKLQIQERGIHGPTIDNTLQNGVAVPEKTGKYVYLTREIYRESLAVGICEGIVMSSDLSESGIKLNYSDVKAYFNRSIPYEMLGDVFEYLRSINACRIKRGDSSYTFTKYNLDVVLSIRQKLIEKPIEEEISDEDTDDSGKNRMLDEFSD